MTVMPQYRRWWKRNLRIIEMPRPPSFLERPGSGSGRPVRRLWRRAGAVTGKRRLGCFPRTVPQPSLSAAIVSGPGLGGPPRCGDLAGLAGAPRLARASGDHGEHTPAALRTGTCAGWPLVQGAEVSDADLDSALCSSLGFQGAKLS